MEHKLDELQQQGSRLGPANLANHDHVTQLEHEIVQLTAENEVWAFSEPSDMCFVSACVAELSAGLPWGCLAPN